jgi:DNA-directed RNA polymerase specialized sigma24 family protein
MLTERTASGTARGWSLSASAFEQLLDVLDGDRDKAARTYEHLRQRTMGLLRWWGAANAEDLADRILDRVARKLEEGAVIPKGSFGAYVRGVARMVYYESTRDPHVQAEDQVLEAVPAPAPAREESRAQACFDRCLGSLDDHDRRLVLKYYDTGKAKHVRSSLAAEMGISATALRIRVHRLREQLEQCVRGCVEGQ